MTQPRRLELERPGEFLAWASSEPDSLSFDDAELAQAWALVGLAALARREQPKPLKLSWSGASRAGAFAQALGLIEARNGKLPAGPLEPHRTVPIQRVARAGDVEATASSIARLLLREEGANETRLTLSYVLVELLRNVIQHSGDPLGAVVAAQVMSGGRGGYSRDTLQVAVADTGMGIPRSLSGLHPEAADSSVALDIAVRPHVSGAFPPGSAGSGENAGLGLFFISEMAKLTAGRLLIATRGAALVISGDEEAGAHRQEAIPFGFPGTLVAFEVALDEVKDFDRMIGVIQQRATERAPDPKPREIIRFSPPPDDEARPVLVSHLAEDIAGARELASKLEAKVVQRQAIALDFRNVRSCTQSFLHALLFDVLRVAWARQVPVHVVNAVPAVQSSLRYLESYALRA